VVGRTGRRPGDSAQTRQAILDAAMQAFAEGGFGKTSIRKIAGVAGVDPALVHHYFGTKDQLFMAALDVPFDPSEVLPRVVAGGRDEVGERLVGTFLALWDSPRGNAAAAVLRSAVAHPWIARLMEEFVLARIVLPAFTEIGVHDKRDREQRATLVVSQILGLALTRYVLRFEPLASTPRIEVIAAVGPTIQRYMTGDIGGGAPQMSAGSGT
jgi:AcrR family transcriptional regulator